MKLIGFFLAFAALGGLGPAPAMEPSNSLAKPLKRPAVSIVELDDVIRVSSRGKTVLEYVKVDKPLPKGLSESYRRSGYIHPLFTPKGRVITGDFPEDHPHQHALFFAWTRSKTGGRRTDFWNLAKREGRVECRGVSKIKQNESEVSFTVNHAFVRGEGKEREDILHETWEVTVYETPEDYFLFDLESVQQCVMDEPLILEKYHYGGMALRANSQWVVDKRKMGGVTPTFLTSEGGDRVNGNATRARWVAISGLLDGEKASVVVMGSPTNFRSPQHVRIHPEKPYFCFAPMVPSEFRIEPGAKYVSRFRYITMDDAADPEVLNSKWRAYAESEGG